jgi:bla regulator protein blaR1
VIKPSLDAEGVTLDEFSKLLNLIVDRPVIDETGVSGRFDIHITFARDQVTTKLPDPAALGVASDPTGPTIFTAVQEQLGLKLVPTKGPVEVLVIDSVERPSAN